MRRVASAAWPGRPFFASSFSGVYIVWDRKIDFLEEVLVTPISRTSAFLGASTAGAMAAGSLAFHRMRV